MNMFVPSDACPRNLPTSRGALCVFVWRTIEAGITLVVLEEVRHLLRNYTVDEMPTCVAKTGLADYPRAMSELNPINERAFQIKVPPAPPPPPAASRDWSPEPGI
jgi:hypothetical protein